MAGGPLSPSAPRPRALRSPWGAQGARAHRQGFPPATRTSSTWGTCSEEEPGGPRGREEGDIARVPAHLLPPLSPPPLPAPPPQEGNEGSGFPGGEVQPPRVVPQPPPPRQPRLEGAVGQDGRTDRFLLHHRPLLPGDQEKAQGEGDGWWRPVVVVVVLVAAAAVGFKAEPAPKLLPLARQPSQNAPNDPLPWDDS